MDKKNSNASADKNRADIFRRRTKILATLNPTNTTPQRIENMIYAGLDASRHNLSHGNIQDHIKLIASIREVSKAIKPVGIVVDIQGPKLRILDFNNSESIKLRRGNQFILDAECGDNHGDENRVGLDYKDLVKDVKPGDRLGLADGIMTLEVKQVKGSEIICEVLTNGQLFGRKGLNKIGGGLSAPALTQKDRQDIKEIAACKPDYFALSFVKSASDIRELRQLLQAENCNAAIIAKIERNEAITNIKEITQEADAIMIARGDLGVEVGDPHLPGFQKRFIKLARSMNRCVITATQMMESMIHNPVPTRAEVFDVANAVLDGTDVVMLSGETAVGKYSVKVIAAMSNIVVGAEQEKLSGISRKRDEERFFDIEESISMSAMYAVNHHYKDHSDELTIKAILALTESGRTSIYMSRVSSGVSIYALSPNIETVRRLTLYRGVYPVHMITKAKEHDDVITEVVRELKEKYPNYIRSGDQVLITKGSKMGETGGTNLLQIITV